MNIWQLYVVIFEIGIIHIIKMCKCIICISVKKNIEYCYYIYKHFKWLIDSYVLDFYVSDHWAQMPDSWTKIFEDITFSEVAVLLDTNVALTTKHVYPLAILALRQLFKMINVSRSPACVQNLYNIPFKHAVYDNTHNFVNDIDFSRDDNSLINHPRLKNIFWKHISPKKKYEITLMGQASVAVARKSQCNIILDFGSGLGHLSRILSYGYGFQVCCLEAQEFLSTQAKKLDMQFEKAAYKYLSKDQFDAMKKPEHINIKIENDSDLAHLIKRVRLALGLESNNIKLGIVGLHPCGDLGAVLLRFFKTCENIIFINMASCCYMKLTTQNSLFLGYPLSKFLNSKENSLSYTARELSCHATESYVDKLKSGHCNELQIHAYRATLETIIIKHQPKKTHIGLRNVKYNNNLTFSEYCSKAINGIDVIIPEDEITSKETLHFLSEWRKVVIFYSLRLMFAPVIETLILLDRFLYVAELDTECALVPLFDPKVSPRSHLLIAVKDILNNKEI